MKNDSYKSLFFFVVYEATLSIAQILWDCMTE
jgi:hypothetical protein